MAWIDLHTHSTASDGTLTPGEIFALAVELQLRAVALTDHDTIAGVPEFLAAGEKHPECEAVPGVELATTWGGKELHIVGLFIDPGSARLQEFLRQCKQERERRNRDLFLRLRSIGYELDPAGADFEGHELSELGRPHFAAALVHQHGFSCSQQVFDRLLARGRSAYVARKLPLPEQAFDAIHAAGGTAVWAHPVLREHNERTMLTKFCRKLVPLGLDALEGYYSTFGPEETKLVSSVAEHFQLAVSGGSDFHGANSPNAILAFGAGGLRVPEELLPALRMRRGGNRVNNGINSGKEEE